MFSHAVVFGLLSLAATSSADTLDPAVRTVRVSYHDLDLTAAAGRATLETRLRHAIREVCPQEGFSGFARATASRCRSKAEVASRIAAVRAEEAAFRRLEEQATRLAARQSDPRVP